MEKEIITNKIIGKKIKELREKKCGLYKNYQKD